MSMGTDTVVIDKRLGRVIRDAYFVADHWPDLHDARIPGTRRPWAQTLTRAESRERANADAAGDITYARTVLGLSSSPTPVHIDVLDSLTAVLAIAHALGDAVATLAGVPRLPAPNSAYDDPRPHLMVVALHLKTAALVDGGWILDAALDPDDDMSIVRARRETARSLRLVLDGHVLDGDCPWCHTRPLRLRIVSGEPLVVCESRRVCEPPNADCGTWVRGRPAWIQPEWDWLAKQMRHADERYIAP